MNYEIGKLKLNFFKMGVIKKSVFKIAILVLIVILNWNGLSAIGRTFAYFNDTEESPGNTYSAGSLDFSLVSENYFAPKVFPHQNSSREIKIVNDGTLGLKYTASTTQISGDLGLCQNLNLTVKINGITKYSGDLVNFAPNSFVSSLPSSAEEKIDFETSLKTDDLSLVNKTCHFNFVFQGWQENFGTYQGGGFNDQETISNEVKSGLWGVVLNEILPNPEGDDWQAGLQGEWVEFYNNNDFPVDMTGWYIEDASQNRQTISISTTYNHRTIIGAKGNYLEWLVLFINRAKLNNDGDTVTLYNQNSIWQDSYTFGKSSNDDDSDSNNTPGGSNENQSGNETAGNEGKSYARIPDGTDNWVDPIPTPGQPNELVQNETAKPNDSVLEVGSASKKTVENEKAVPKNSSQDKNAVFNTDSGEKNATGEEEDSSVQPDISGTSADSSAVEKDLPSNGSVAEEQSAFQPEALTNSDSGTTGLNSDNNSAVGSGQDEEAGDMEAGSEKANDNQKLGSEPEQTGDSDQSILSTDSPLEASPDPGDSNDSSIETDTSGEKDALTGNDGGNLGEADSGNEEESGGEPVADSGGSDMDSGSADSDSGESDTGEPTNTDDNSGNLNDQVEEGAIQEPEQPVIEQEPATAPNDDSKIEEPTSAVSGGDEDSAGDGDSSGKDDSNNDGASSANGESESDINK